MSGPINTRRNVPLRTKNSPMTHYPVTEVKKERITRLKLASMEDVRFCSQTFDSTQGYSLSIQILLRSGIKTTQEL